MEKFKDSKKLQHLQILMRLREHLSLLKKNERRKRKKLRQGQKKKLKQQKTQKQPRKSQLQMPKQRLLQRWQPPQILELQENIHNKTQLIQINLKWHRIVQVLKCQLLRLWARCSNTSSMQTILKKKEFLVWLLMTIKLIRLSTQKSLISELASEQNMFSSKVVKKLKSLTRFSVSVKSKVINNLND